MTIPVRPLAAALAALGLLLAAASPAREAERFPRAAVVSVDGRASAAGLSMLEAGGNAADAAVATALALEVVHPQAGSIGGGNMILWRGAGSEVEVIDGRETAPAAARREMFLDDSGRPKPGLSLDSIAAAGVPGGVAALALLHARHGSLPWRRLVEPAVRLAARGAPVSRRLAFDVGRQQERLQRDDVAAALFLPHGAPITEGLRLRRPALARTLRRLGAGGAESFYRGRLAAAVLTDLGNRDALITAADLRGYQARIRRPIRTLYRDHVIWTPPPPSAGGLAVAQALRLLERFEPGPEAAGGSQLLHLVAEAMRRAYADRHRWLGDPDFVEVPLERLLDAQRLEEWSNGISPQRATPSREIFRPVTAARSSPVPAERGETTHLSVVDAEGNAVSLTMTLNRLFGNGMLARDLGFFWNDEMDDFSTAPGVPDSYGIPGSEPNAIAPGKRPLSSMSPTIGERRGELAFVLGSPGGSTIPSSVVQVILGLVDLQLDPQEAVDAARVHHQGLPDRLEHERLPPDVLQGLERRGHRLHLRSSSQGDVHLIAVDAHGNRLAAADWRRGGAARGN